MKNIQYVAILLLFLNRTPAEAGRVNFCHSQNDNFTSQVQPIDIILDLDGTLIYSFPKGKPDVRVFNPNIGGEITFGFAHGTIEFLKSIQNLPRVKLSFFSAGEKWRNQAVVKKIMSQVDSFSFLNCWSPPYRVLSKEDLGGSGEKDLTRVRPRINLDRAILVDDKGYVPASQKYNVLKIDEGLGSEGLCGHGDTNFRISNNLVRALGIILKAIDEAEKNRTSISHVLFQLQKNEEDHSWNEATDTDEFYDLGLQEMRKYNPSFNLKNSAAKRTPNKL